MNKYAGQGEHTARLARTFDSGFGPEEAADLRRAFKQLRRKDRQMLWMAYVEGRKSGDIAADLGVSAAAARQRISRAASRLRTALDNTERRGHQ